MPSPFGLMAPTIINSDAVQGEAFLPEQIFVFGGFALRANSLGHLEQIESYAPGHQVRFGSLNYTADIRGDLIFDGFEPMTGAFNIMMSTTYICHRTVFMCSHLQLPRL